jgi:hypothetical protein
MTLAIGFVLSTLVWLYHWIVQSQRYTRRDAVPVKEPTVEEAFQIALQLHQKEFPWIMNLSLELGLFKTYAIPSISKILARTKEFELFPGRRYDDTNLLLCEMVQCPVWLHKPTGSRSETALRRLNYIHSQYPIQNSDMLYTMCVFIIEPIRWVQRFGWRSLTKTEQTSLFLRWTHIGSQMGIRDIPTSLEALMVFYDSYEQNVAYHPDNHIVAQHTMKLFLGRIPSFFKSSVQRVLEALLHPRVNAAFGFRPASSGLRVLLHVVLRLRAAFVRNWMLPRTVPVTVLQERTPSGLLIPKFHKYEKTYEHGYRIEDLGPMKLKPGILMTECPYYRK